MRIAFGCAGSRLFFFFYFYYFFFRRGIEFLSSWLLTRLALPTFDNSQRLSFKTDGTKLDQDSIQLETGAAISAFSRRRPPPPVFIAVPFFFFLFLFFFFFLYFSPAAVGSFLSDSSCPLFSFVLVDEIFKPETQRKKVVVVLFVQESDKLPVFYIALHQSSNKQTREKK